MSQTPAIAIRGLGKRYQLGETVSSNTLRDALTAGARRLVTRARGTSSRPTDFWALKDVSFEVAQGEVVGIIGHNGAGKSTLLKILSGITEPTEGEIRVRGRIGALLEVGTGFHQELSGRENIFMNGAILGMTQADIRRKFDEIVAFAGVEQFLDTPVKRYSSGMLLRLGFAVAAHLEPEILVIDEVLAVGDAEFQRKCLGKIEDVSQSGRTILFVSHNMAAIEALCARAFCLNKGRVACHGPVTEVISNYLAQDPHLSTNGQPTQDTSGRFSLRLESSNALRPGLFRTGDDISMWVTLTSEPEPRSDLELVVSLLSSANERIMTLANSYQAARLMRTTDNAAQCVIRNCRLSAGTYRVLLKVFDHHKNVIARLDKLRITIVESDCYGTGKVMPPKFGRIVPECEWRYHSIPAPVHMQPDSAATV